MNLHSILTGQECLIKGKLDEAVETFTEVITAEPANKKFNKVLYELRGEANLHLCYYLAAFTDFSEALKIGEKSARCLYMRACCHHAMAQFEDCIIDCEASLKIQWTQHAQTLFEDVINLMESDKKCPYRTLGVSKNASIEEIRTAYQNLTLKYHPNQNKFATEEERLKLDWKFEEVANAYVKLTQTPMRALSQPKQTHQKVQPKQTQQKPQFSSRDQQLKHIENELKNVTIQKKALKKAKQDMSKDECSVM